MTEEKWKKETAAGGIVFKKQDGSVFVLMVNPKQKDFGPPQPYWTWPKGMYKEGENKEQAALREVKEEGGVEAKIIESLSYVKFFKSYVKTIKFVDFFLMEYISGDPKDHDDEMANAEWVKIDEAESRLKFPHDKEVLKRAIEKIT